MAGQFTFDSNNNILHCEGHWDIHTISSIKTRIEKLNIPHQNQITLAGNKLETLDSAGALLLQQFIQKFKKNNQRIQLVDFKKVHQDVLDIIQEKEVQAFNLLLSALQFLMMSGI